ERTRVRAATELLRWMVTIVFPHLVPVSVQTLCPGAGARCGRFGDRRDLAVRAMLAGRWLRCSRSTRNRWCLHRARHAHQEALGLSLVPQTRGFCPVWQEPGDRMRPLRSGLLQ